MGHLIEIVFEKARPAGAALMVADLAEGGGVVDIATVPDTTLIGASTEERVQAWINGGMPGSLTVRLHKLNVGPFEVPRAAIRSVACDRQLVDVEISFDIDDVRGVDSGSFTASLCALAGTFARKHGVTNYNCGLEPAADEKTRLFTGESVGPLRLPNW